MALQEIPNDEKRLLSSPYRALRSYIGPLEAPLMKKRPFKEFEAWHNILFLNRKFANGVYEVLCWFGTNLIVSFQEISQIIFCNLAKVSDPAELQIYYIAFHLLKPV